MTLKSKAVDPAILFVVIATIALSFKGILAKFVYAAETNVDFLLLVRFAVAAPLFWLGVRLIHGHVRGITGRQWIACSGAGGLFFIATYFDFSALALIDAGLSRLILFTFPVFVVLLSSMLERRWPTGQHLIAFTVTYFGLMMVVTLQGWGQLSGSQLLGIGYAFGASISYALYLVSSQMIMKTLSSSRFTAASGTTTFVLMLGFIGLTDRWDGLIYSPEGLGWSLLIGIACTVIPFFLLYEAIKRCGASRASLIALTGPAITMVFAWLWLDETLSSAQVIGMVVTTAGIAILEMRALQALVQQLGVKFTFSLMALHKLTVPRHQYL